MHSFTWTCASFRFDKCVVEMFYTKLIIITIDQLLKYWFSILRNSLQHLWISPKVWQYFAQIIFYLIWLCYNWTWEFIEITRKLITLKFSVCLVFLVKKNPPLCLITTWRFPIATICTNKRIANQFVQFFPNLFYWNVIWAMKPTNFTPTPTK